MESKIEKLKLVNHDLIVDFDRIESKINEIIDHLNSQDQEEQKGTLKELEDNYLYSLRTANKPMSQNTPKGWIDEVTKVEIKDTPEQKEEGGCKGFWSYYRNKGDDRELAYLIVDGEKFLSEESVKNLLSERERWAIHTFLKDTASYNSFHNGRPRTMRNGLSGEGFEVRVSKLNKKK